MIRRHIAFALALLGLAALALPAAAFQVRPVRLDLDRQRPATQVTVSNPTARPLLIQAEAFDWTQQGSDNQLRASESLILNPPIFELAPGASQVVRVGLRRGAEPGRERSHRLWFTQLLTPADRAAGGVQMALRVSLPVFVLGEQTGAPEARWNRTADTLLLGNRGARHLHVRGLQIDTADGSQATLGPCYALPDGACSWPLPPALQGRALRVRADTDAGQLEGRPDAPAPH